jgi:hypothetical protein
VNALSDPRVAQYINENFVATYLKVGTFQIINGQKVGGNVASYFCLWDGSVVHAVPSKVEADQLLSEARWAVDVRKSALMFATDLGTGNINMTRYRYKMMQANVERYHAETNSSASGSGSDIQLPMSLPREQSQQAQAEWVLARNPLAQLNDVYPYLWTQILQEKLSDVPVTKR